MQILNFVFIQESHEAGLCNSLQLEKYTIFHVNEKKENGKLDPWELLLHAAVCCYLLLLFAARNNKSSLHVGH